MPSEQETKELIHKLVRHMERADPEAEREVPILLDIIVKTFQPETAVLAEQAIVAWRGAMTTCPRKHPRLWASRFQRFIGLTEAIYKIELGDGLEAYHDSLLQDCYKKEKQ